MADFSFEKNFRFSTVAPRLFKAFCLDYDRLMPEIQPEAIKSVETLLGDGGVGTVKKITLGEECQFKSVVHEVDEINEENLVYKYSINYGDGLIGVLDKISYEINIEASPDGDRGSISKYKCKYYPKADSQISQEQIKQLHFVDMQATLGMLRAVEAYLLANPDAYK